MTQDFVFCAQPPISPSPGVQTALMRAFKLMPPETVWQSRDLATVAGVYRGSARGALQELIRKMQVTYAYENGEVAGFRLVVENDWR